jgi:hypothetical protein
MLVYQDLLSGKDVGTDSYPAKQIAGGAIIAMESKKITVGVDEDAIAKATGANDSKEEAAEKVDSEAKAVINIVNAHDLQLMKMDKKEYKTMQKAYWTDLKKAIDAQRFDALGLGKEYKPPSDKKAAADAEKAAEAKLGKFEKGPLEAANKRLESYKKNFNALAAFVKDEVEKNFEEFDFYIPGDGAELGKCMIIPARFVGEATTPTFFYFIDGLEEKKF